MKINRTFAALGLALMLSLGATAESPAEIPGEGLSGSLMPAQEEGGLFRLTPEELENLGLIRSTKPAPTVSPEETVATEMAPIMVSVKVTRYVKVPVYSHKRRSLASRGAGAAPQNPVVGYKNVAKKSVEQVDITPIILAKAKKYNLDPRLVRGVIEVESAFKPYAVSHAGAGGLMQLMPGTAYHLGCRDRFDPEQNIEAGAKYLRQMMDRFGNWDLAIAAYNAGPGNVERAGGIPPFRETQRYVVKVRKAWGVKAK